MSPGGKPNPRGPGQFRKIICYGYELIVSYFLERVDARNRMYITISCQEKNPEQKILFFHDEKLFLKIELDS